ncbi:TnpA family transposase [Streptomyces sp. TE3672]
MPVEFLTDDQAASYGSFKEVPPRPELERFFFLDDEDRLLIAKRRGDHNRLGFALQICTVRYVGLFLADPLDVPWAVVDYLAEQLGVEDASCVKRYTERQMTPYEHAWEIRDAYGYRDFEDAGWGRRFRTFLHGRAWTHAEGPVALFDHAVAWLRRHRVLLPGVSVLARQVSEVRAVAEKRLHATVARAAHRADAALPGELVRLLEVPDGARVSELERLRRPPTRTTGTAMARALDRVNEISAFQLGRVNLTRVPVNRLTTLARYGLASKAQTLERSAEPKRTALLTAVVRSLEAAAIDDALDLFALLMATRLINPARRVSDRERLVMLPHLEKASRTVAKAARVLIRELELTDEVEADLDVAALWRALEEVVSRAAVNSAVRVVEQLVPEDDGSAEIALRQQLTGRYNTVRPFLALLGDSDALGAAQGGRRVLKAVRRLPVLARRKVAQRPLLPKEIDAELVPPAWRKAVYSNTALPEGAVDRDAYVVCVLEQLHRALTRRDVFAAPSNRWSDPRARLLDGARWEAVREDVLAGLSLTEPVDEHLDGLTCGLDTAWRQMAARLEEAGPAAKVEIVVPPEGGRARLSVDKLGALGESRSLNWLRKTTLAMLPRIDLPDLLFEVHSWTGFLDAFTHVSTSATRMEGLPVSLVALLVSESCNIGLTPVTNPAYPELTRSRLSHVDQNYLRADTIAASNALLISAQARVPLAQSWGGGMLASVDGLRFVVPKRSINSAPSPKYFGQKRGLTWLNALNDQVSGIGAMLVPGTPRDSLFILDTLLNLDGGVRPEMVATDNASPVDRRPVRPARTRRAGPASAPVGAAASGRTSATQRRCRASCAADGIGARRPQPFPRSGWLPCPAGRGAVLPVRGPKGPVAQVLPGLPVETSRRTDEPGATGSAPPRGSLLITCPAGAFQSVCRMIVQLSPSPRSRLPACSTGMPARSGSAMPAPAVCSCSCVGVASALPLLGVPVASGVHAPFAGVDRDGEAPGAGGTGFSAKNPTVAHASTQHAAAVPRSARRVRLRLTTRSIAAASTTGAVGPSAKEATAARSSASRPGSNGAGPDDVFLTSYLRKRPTGCAAPGRPIRNRAAWPGRGRAGTSPHSKRCPGCRRPAGRPDRAGSTGPPRCACPSAARAVPRSVPRADPPARTGPGGRPSRAPPTARGAHPGATAAASGRWPG